MTYLSNFSKLDDIFNKIIININKKKINYIQIIKYNYNNLNIINSLIKNKIKFSN